MELDNKPDGTNISNPLPEEPKKKKRTRRRKKAKNKSEDDPITTTAKKTTKTKRKRKRRNRTNGEDRYFGRFFCPNCRKSWASSHVYTFPGTKKVKYRQRCKTCLDSWCFPNGLDMMRCSRCGGKGDQCVCLCEDCGKQWRRPREKVQHKNIGENDKGNDLRVNDSTGTQEEDEDSYCCCDRRRKRGAVGQNIDTKKPHLRDMCMRCLSGRLCVGGMNDDATHQEEDDILENEP